MGGSASHKDVVLAVVGAGAGLAGLVLVFLGTLVTSYQSLLGKVSERTLLRVKRASVLALAAFVVSLASVVLGVVWLAASGGDAFYAFTLAAFFVDLAVLVGLAVYATVHVLLRA